MQKSFPSLFHFDQATLKPLPKFVVGGPSDITRVPDIVLNEFFDLVLPLGFEHHLLDGLHCDHQPVNVLYQHIIARNQKFFTSSLLPCRASTCLIDRLELTSR